MSKQKWWSLRTIDPFTQFELFTSWNHTPEIWSQSSNPMLAIFMLQGFKIEMSAKEWIIWSDGWNNYDNSFFSKKTICDSFVPQHFEAYGYMFWWFVISFLKWWKDFHQASEKKDIFNFLRISHLHNNWRMKTIQASESLLKDASFGTKRRFLAQFV